MKLFRLLRLGKLEQLTILLPMVVLLDHFMSALLSFFLLIKENDDFHAGFGFIPTKILWQPIKGH